MSSGVSGATSSSVRRRTVRKRDASAVAFSKLAAVAMAVRLLSLGIVYSRGAFQSCVPLLTIWDYNLCRSFVQPGGRHESHLRTSL